MIAEEQLKKVVAPQKVQIIYVLLVIVLAMEDVLFLVLLHALKPVAVDVLVLVLVVVVMDV